MTVASGRRPSAGDDRPPGERLLSAAEELFGERSYRRTSVADICARAGIATGSFYAHYGSKNDIFAAVVRRINADLRAAMRAALESEDVLDGQRDRERAAFRAFFQMLSKRPWIDRIVRESEFVDPALFREYYERLARGYARGVRRAQLAGDVDPHYDPEVIAYVYTGIGNFVGMRWADWTAGGQVPPDVLEDMLSVLARGLPPRPNPAFAATRATPAAGAPPPPAPGAPPPPATRSRPRRAPPEAHTAAQLGHTLRAAARPPGAQPRPPAVTGGPEPGQPGFVGQQLVDPVLGRHRHHRPDPAAGHGQPLTRLLGERSDRFRTHTPLSPVRGYA